jgi:hypothetical protein
MIVSVVSVIIAVIIARMMVHLVLFVRVIVIDMVLSIAIFGVNRRVVFLAVVI